MSSRSGMTPIPKSPAPPARSGTPEPMDERHLRVVRTPPTPPVRTEVKKHLVFALSPQGWSAHIIVGIEDPETKYNLKPGDVPSNLYAFQMSNKPYTRNELRNYNYRELLKVILEVSEEEAKEHIVSGNVIVANSDAREILKRPTFIYSIDIEEGGGRIATAEGKFDPRFLDALFSGDTDKLDRLTGIAATIDVLLIVDTADRAYFVFCERKDVPERLLPYPYDKLHPIKVSGPFTQKELLDRPYADLVALDRPDEERRTAEMIAPEVLNQPRCFVYKIEDLAESQGKMITSDGKLGQTFVQALFEKDEESLEGMLLFRLDVEFDK